MRHTENQNFVGHFTLASFFGMIPNSAMAFKFLKDKGPKQYCLLSRPTRFFSAVIKWSGASSNLPIFYSPLKLKCMILFIDGSIKLLFLDVVAGLHIHLSLIIRSRIIRWENLLNLPKPEADPKTATLEALVSDTVRLYCLCC